MVYFASFFPRIIAFEVLELMEFPLTSPFTLLMQLLLALALDQWLGEPRRWHPLVGFGRLAQWLETKLNSGNDQQRFWRGLVAWSLAVLPLTWLTLQMSAVFGMLFQIVLLYLTIGRKSLFEHSRRVWQALQEQDLPAARHHTGMIVSRETSQLDATGCTRATVESVLENANDGIVGALFWFALLGAPGAVLYRLANTLDAMWGYRNERFNWFGCAAARLDDVLNFLPARLCALAYAAAGQFQVAMHAWKTQAHLLKSPNGGPVMCAGAGALDLQLGGPAVYHGTPLDKPFFGGEYVPQAQDILRANQLVDRALAILLPGFALTGFLLAGFFL
ncbi:MAG TPA: adenosylcobinamide-phosphate synthase CbiB [Dongiaceae bacterium]|nr:adenosylcobinamide-phosphate synthase CbiB [Dongiaceae bacterium]